MIENIEILDEIVNSTSSIKFYNIMYREYIALYKNYIIVIYPYALEIYKILKPIKNFNKYLFDEQDCIKILRIHHTDFVDKRTKFNACDIFKKITGIDVFESPRHNLFTFTTGIYDLEVLKFNRQLFLQLRKEKLNKLVQ